MQGPPRRELPVLPSSLGNREDRMPSRLPTRKSKSRQSTAKSDKQGRQFLHEFLSPRIMLRRPVTAIPVYLTCGDTYHFQMFRAASLIFGCRPAPHSASQQPVYIAPSRASTFALESKILSRADARNPNQSSNIKMQMNYSELLN